MKLRKRLAALLDPTTPVRLSDLRVRYGVLWDDHLRRCDCHDSWDQCPCTETGHKTREARMACANKCCPSCSSEWTWELTRDRWA